MGVRVPHRLGLAALVPLGVRASFGGDGVDDLAVGEGVPGPVEVRLQIPGGADLPMSVVTAMLLGAPDPRGRGPAGPQAMNRSRASSRAVRLAAESMPAPGDHHKLLDAVGGLEGLRDGDDRGGLSLISFPAPDSQGETTAVDQQADDDLGVDPPVLGITHPPQIILTLGLEVQGGDACRHRARPHWR